MSERLAVTFHVGGQSISYKTKIRAFDNDFANRADNAAEEWEMSVKKELPRLIEAVMRKWVENND